MEELNQLVIDYYPNNFDNNNEEVSIVDIIDENTIVYFFNKN